MLKREALISRLVVTLERQQLHRELRVLEAQFDELCGVPIRRTLLHRALRGFGLRAWRNVAGVLEAREHLIDQTAWHARNLYELHATMRWVLLSDDNLTAWMDRKAFDERDFLAAAAIRMRARDEPEKALVIESRLAHIDSIAAKWGKQRRRLPSLKARAKAVGMDEHYGLEYALESFYVHPSSWLVNGAHEEVDNEDFREMFEVQSLLDAKPIYDHIAGELRA